MSNDVIWLAAIALATLLAAPGWAAIYIVRRREPVSTYASMEDTIKALSDQVRSTHLDMLKLQNKVAELSLGVRVLSAQVRRLGHEPEYKEALDIRQEDTGYDPAALQRRMARQFNMDELNDLAFQMKIQTGEVGEDTVSGRARAIINYADRRGELAQLVALCRQLRPKGGF